MLFFNTLEKSKDELCIFLSARDDICSSWDRELQNCMENLGLTSDFYNNIQNSYIGIINEGKVILDSFGEYPLRANYDLEFNNGEKRLVNIQSGGFLYGDMSHIFISEKDYSMNNRGLNIVALDKDKGEVLVSVSIDTWSEGLEYEEKIWDDKLWENYKENGNILVQDGTYLIVSGKNPDYVFDIPEGKKTDGVALTLCSANGGKSQQFEVKYCGSGLYTIRAICSGKYLTASRFGNIGGTSITQEKYTGLSNQKWFIYKNKGSTYTIMSYYNCLVVDTTVEEIELGRTLQIWENDNKEDEEGQQFYLEKVVPIIKKVS